MFSPCKHLLRSEVLGNESLHICKKLIEFECSGYITNISIELSQPTINSEFWCLFNAHNKLLYATEERVSGNTAT